MSADATSYKCTFCGRKIEAGNTHSWSEGISIVARHVLGCDQVSETVTSAQRSLAIDQMASSIVKYPPAR